MTKCELEAIINSLSDERKIFHSEADFQFALAWEIQKTYPQANVRLEYSPANINPSIHLDLLVVIDDGWYPIELKYKTRACTKMVGKEIFKLKNHDAQDFGRYDFLKDVQRIESLKIGLPQYRSGYSILLSNDSVYWSNSSKETSMGYAFCLEEGTIKTGSLRWANHTGVGTLKGREKPIVLSSQYDIRWNDYSYLDDTNTGLFKYLIFCVEGEFSK